MTTTARAGRRSGSAHVQSAPAWIWITTGVSALAGFAVSVYLTVEHYTASTTLACPDTGVVNCVKVTTSPQSTIAGIPLAVLGLAYFLGMIVLAIPRLWRDRTRRVRWSRTGLAATGAVAVVYLLYVDLFVVDAICLWCTAVHAAALTLFIVTGYREVVQPPHRLTGSPSPPILRSVIKPQARSGLLPVMG